MCRHFLRFTLAIGLVVTIVACSQPGKTTGGPGAGKTVSADVHTIDVAPAVAKTYSVEGVYVEACSCRGTCQAEVSGAATGCDALGAAEIVKGTGDGRDISGTRMAFAVDHGDQLHLYLDAPDAARRGALEAFARAAFAGFGKVQSVTQAHITLVGKDGAYTVQVNGGRVMSLTTEPVLGGDHKTAVAIENSMHPLNPTLYQGKCMGAAYTDGGRAFSLEKGRNSFFNQHMKAATAG